MSMIELERRDPPGAARAAMMLQRAHWAAEGFARFDHERVVRILDAVAAAAEAKAEEYAEWAVAETGMGVVEHKALKNRMCSRGLWDTYRDHDYVSPRIRHDDKILELPRPAGVIFALTPTTNPIATTYFKVLLALMTPGFFVAAFTLKASHRAIGIGMYMALIMAFNVWFIIWPNQQKILGLVEATAEQKAADAKPALYASRFNTMFSIGMLYCMVAQQNGGL